MAGNDSNRTMRALLRWATPTRSLGLVAAAGSLSATIAFGPTPLAERLIEADTRESAITYEARILRQLPAGEATFTTGVLPQGDRMALAAVTRSSDINLLDRKGRVVWSSRPDLIGPLDAGDQFAGTAAEGDVACGIDLVPPLEVDDVVRTAIGGEPDRRPRVVAGIGLPVVLDGDFVGVLELRSNSTRQREAFAARPVRPAPEPVSRPAPPGRYRTATEAGQRPGPMPTVGLNRVAPAPQASPRPAPSRRRDTGPGSSTDAIASPGSRHDTSPKTAPCAASRHA